MKKKDTIIFQNRLYYKCNNSLTIELFNTEIPPVQILNGKCMLDQIERLFVALVNRIIHF